MRLLSKEFLKPVCEHCGSPRVIADGYVGWNPQALRWEVIETQEHNATCGHCQSDTKVVWVHIDALEPEDGQ